MPNRIIYFPILFPSKKLRDKPAAQMPASFRFGKNGAFTLTLMVRNTGSFRPM